MLPLAFAWFAAAAFAVSLGFFLYAYLVLFGVPAPAWESAPAGLPSAGSQGIAAPAVFNLLLFTIFALHHSLFARTRFKQVVRARVRPDLERAVYTLVASGLFLVVCWLWLPVAGRAWRLDGMWRWLGYAVQAAGLAVTISGARALDVLDLAGVRQLTRRQAVRARLETRGVYGLVRHPLYFGWTLLVFGAPDMTHTRLVFAVVSTLYLVVAIPFEERGLVETFGSDYAAYQRKVRSRIFPGVH